MNKPTIRGIDHIGITVPDIETATTFLCEALGAKVIYESLKHTTPIPVATEAALNNTYAYGQTP